MGKCSGPRNKFTPTQVRMLQVLSDGEPHTYQELHNCLRDELSYKGNMYCHITILRKKLLRETPKQTIICEVNGGWRRERMYRHVILLSKSPTSVSKSK